MEIAKKCAIVNNIIHQLLFRDNRYCMWLNNLIFVGVVGVMGSAPRVPVHHEAVHGKLLPRINCARVPHGPVQFMGHPTDCER